MYARLRGIEEAKIKDIVDQLIDTLMLRKHADKQTMNYRWVRLDCQLISKRASSIQLIKTRDPFSGKAAFTYMNLMCNM